MNFNKTVKLLGLGVVVVEFILDQMSVMYNPTDVHPQIRNVKGK